MNVILHALSLHVEETQRKKPRITETWKRDVRLLIDNDKVTVDEAVRVISWLRSPTGGDFWAVNILSPAKLRKHFPRLAREAHFGVQRNNRPSFRDEAMERNREDLRQAYLAAKRKEQSE